MQIKVNKSIAKGVINVPSSKSYAHRFLLSAALSNKTCLIKNIDLSKDIEATLSCLKTLGKSYSYENKIIKIETIKNFDELDEELVFECGESASTLRFMIPIALLTKRKLIFKCSTKLISRGINSYLDIFKKQDISYSILEDRILLNGFLKPGEYILSNLNSSQYISGLLFALPLLNKQSKIIIKGDLVSENYIEMTLNVLKNFNINIIRNNNEFIINENQKYIGSDFILEGDYSSAAFIEFLNYIDGDVKLIGLNKDSLQGDKVFFELFKKLKQDYQVIDLKNCIDLGPILFTFASLYHGARFINTSRLKEKESDRVSLMCEELRKFNALIEEKENEVIIKKSSLSSPNGILSSHNDHRIAMSLIVLLSHFGGILDGVEAIEKSYPDFLKDIKSIGITYQIISKGSE